MPLDFITEKQNYASHIEEIDAADRLYKLMVNHLCEFIVAVRNLSERQVELLLLRAKGFTYEQIGDLLGITKQTVHGSVVKTIRQLEGIAKNMETGLKEKS